MAINSPVPTPDGWQRAEDVRVGDMLLDERGLPTRVVGVGSALEGAATYRVTFRDGTDIVACGHQVWPVREFVGRYVDRPVTTAAMYSTGLTFDRALTSGRTKASRAGVARWRTMPTPALEFLERDLPLPPYLLGYWLGDGDRDGPRLTVSEEDLPSLEDQITVVGGRVVSRQRTHGNTFRIRFDLGGYGTGIRALRELGVLNDKHVPEVVFRAARLQRLAVLQGLVDSDGYVEKGTNRVEICLTLGRLAADVVRLVRTLGLYPRMNTVAAVLRGRSTGVRHRINFTAYREDAVSRLHRKAERLSPRGRSVPYSRVRTVTSVKAINSGAVYRIEVDSPSGLYLAGDGLVPIASG